MLVALLVLAVGSAARAQSATGTIAGRVYSPATREYIHNAEVRVAGTDILAYTQDDGSYRLNGVPAGTATITVLYTGYNQGTASVTVSAGATARRDFDLLPTAAPGESEVLRLDQVVVNSEREGNAKAITDQREALNLKNVVASDNFGDVSQGNIGEFLRYMPGIVLDYTESDTRAARIGGLDPKYAGVTVDGGRMASAASAAFGSTTRQFEFEQTSINNIESIEVNKTLNAAMDADSPAGNINLRSKNAFELKGRRIDYQVGLQANSWDMTFHKTPGPDNGNHLKIFPAFVLNYSDSFNDRLGVSVSVSDNSGYTEQFRNQINYDYGDLTRGPVITSITWRPGPKISRRSSSAINVDYKISSDLVFKFRSNFSHFDDEFVNRALVLTANRGDIAANSTLTSVIANANGTNTKLQVGTEQHRAKFNDTVFVQPQLVYRHNALEIVATESYSRSTTHYEDMARGFFSDARQQLTRMSWMATRPSTSSTDWTVTELSGPDWSDPTNYNKDTFNNNIGTTWNRATNQLFTTKLDAKERLTLVLPVELAAGGSSRLSTYSGHSLGSPWGTWTYNGPNGRWLIPEDNYRFDPRGMGGNIYAQNWPFPERTALYNLYVAHPEYFTENTFGNVKNLFLSPRTLNEEIDSAYAMATTVWKRLRWNVGLRYERTAEQVKNFIALPNIVVKNAGYPVDSSGNPNTIPGLQYQYENGARSWTKSHYANNFFDTGLKCRLLANLDALLAYSESIGRPDYSNLSGTVTANDTTQVVSLPNPNLKPEKGRKMSASLDYYLNPAGLFSVSGYVFQIRNGVGARVPVTPEQALAAGVDPSQYLGYTFNQLTNDPSERRIEGVEVSYSQRLTFLPGALRGLSVYGSVTRVHADIQRQNEVPKAASGRVAYSYRKFSTYLGATWTSAKITNTPGGVETQWQKERLILNMGATYRVSPHADLFVSGSNILNEPVLYYSNEPGRLREKDSYGTKYWSFGVKGRF